MTAHKRILIIIIILLMVYSAFSAEINGEGLYGGSERIFNNIITDNIGFPVTYGYPTANRYNQGGGICKYSGTISNNIISRNVPDALYERSGTTSNSIIIGSIRESSLPKYCGLNIPTQATGNIFNTPGLSADYRLLANSPCIDAGNPDESYNDLNMPPGLGIPRNDMGAYGGFNNFDPVMSSAPDLYQKQDIIDCILGKSNLGSADVNLVHITNAADLIRHLRNHNY